LYHLTKLAKKIGINDLWIKDDGINPSASFKDRASSVGVAKAILNDKDTVTAASTGNAASSLSLFAAVANLRAVIFVPKSAPQAKIAQLLMYQAEVIAVDGSYDQAFDLCLEVAIKKNWYCRNTAVNPYLGEGKKTAAFEICEQLNYDVPDAVVVSAGDGCIVGSLWKGFNDFLRLGLIDRLPRIYAIQAEGASPLVKAFEQGKKVAEPEDDLETFADSICVGRPRDHIKALRAVYESKGGMLAVSDQAIMDAMRGLAKEAGVFAEPAAAASYAGFCALVSSGQIKADERAVVQITGNGLKDIPGVMAAVDRQPITVEPKLESILKVV
jgi:threonine synthase